MARAALRPTALAVGDLSEQAERNLEAIKSAFQNLIQLYRAAVSAQRPALRDGASTAGAVERYP